MENPEETKPEKERLREKPIKAACVVVKNPEGKILLFKSSYERTSGKMEAVGLPAGLIDTTNEDTKEAPETAAARELFEEAGLRVKGPLILLYDGETASAKRVVTYLCTNWEGELRASQEGLVYWGEPEELTGDSGGYPDYNRKVLEALKKINCHIKE